MSKEQRTFSRVETHIKAHARPVSSPEAMPTFNDCQACAAGFDHERLKKSNLPDAMVEFLISLDNKLDMLISLGSSERLSSDYPLRLDVVEISGAGLIFVSEDSFAEGDLLELVLVLNAFPLRFSGAVGRVVRVDERSDPTRYVLDFTKIREQDLESVIQFVFSEQRSMIREKKWT